MNSDDAAVDRSRDFVALMRCEAGDRWFPDAIAQVHSWLREKNFDVDLYDSADHTSGARTLTVRRLDGNGHDLRVQLVERNTNAGTWTTELLVHDEPGADDWISLVVRNDQGRFVNVPRLARYLMQVVQLGDGAIEFHDGPQVFGSTDLDRLITLLSDTERHGLVFVAGSGDDPGLPFDAFRRKVGEWAKEVYGLAQVVVLDPAATSALSDRIGTQFEAPAWTIRTYQPGVDLDDASDARRHRILGTGRLATKPDAWTRRLLGEIARQQAATRAIDHAVQRVRHRLERFENRRLVDSLAAAADSAATVLNSGPIERPDLVEIAEPPPEVGTDDAALLTMVRHTLGIETITEQSLLRAVAARIDRSAVSALEVRVNDLQSTKEQLEDERSELMAALDDAQIEIEVSNLDLDNRDGKISWLEARLKERGDYEATYLDVPVEFTISRPDSFEQLLDQVEATDGICFTGDPSEVVKLNQIDTNNAALRTAWDAVLAMYDYAKARAAGDWNQGLDQYLKCPPDGYRSIAAGKFGASETAATMRAHGAERQFPVPTSVHPSSRIEMKAHFKLARIGMASPRMYVLDRHPNDPCLYIGYIGPHLTNTQTR